MKYPRIVIAGVSSGVGKTSVSLALTAALRRRGLRVQTFKVGPDFLDPTYLAIASGRPCYNLDSWMSGKSYVEGLFLRAARDADLSVIEGVMGLFDGSSPDNSEGSTAEIARCLGAPVLLVANVHGMARSLAPLVNGYSTFEEGVRIGGVLANQCGSARHAAWLSKSLASASLPRIVGAIPRGALPSLSSRHLGLVSANHRRLSAFVLEELADAFERHVSMDKILAMAQEAPPLPDSVMRKPEKAKGPQIAVARDEAFHFYYQDLFDELQAVGCSLSFFSPLRENRLPERADALYLGGGYPEEHAAELAANEPMLSDVRRFAGSGRPIYAECGGLMYLSERILARDRSEHGMVGLLPAEARMLDRKKVLGYVEVDLRANSLWGGKGTVIRGHEFHYSELASSPLSDGWQSVYGVRRRQSVQSVEEGFQRGNILASYCHLHLASHPEAIDHFISCCRRKGTS